VPDRLKPGRCLRLRKCVRVIKGKEKCNYFCREEKKERNLSLSVSINVIMHAVHYKPISSGLIYFAKADKRGFVLQVSKDHTYISFAKNVS
jgi:hypothetical protein